MYRHRTLSCGAALTVAALGLSGCAHQQPALPSSAVPLTSTTAVAASQAAELPTPEALADVLYRLADPAVPGAEKLDLIDGAKPADAATLDKFTTALKDGGDLPLTFEVADIAWSDREPGNAVATVNVTTPDPETGGFSFPMEFTPRPDGWRLAAKTAEMLLAFPQSRAGAAADATPTR
jgi:hypothetical protein